MELDSHIQAILLNNPGAVSYRLAQLGVLQEQTNDPNVLMGYISNRIGSGSDGGYQFLKDALNVPVDVYGRGGNELLNFYAENGNQILINAYLDQIKADVRVSQNSNTAPIILGKPFSIQDLMMCLVCVFLVVLTVFIIKKI